MKKPAAKNTIITVLIMTGFILILSACAGDADAGKENMDEKIGEAAENVTENTDDTVSDAGDAIMMPVADTDDGDYMEELSAGSGRESGSPDGSEPETEVAEGTEQGSETETESASESETESEAEAEPEAEQDEEPEEGTFTSEPVPDDVFARMQGVSFPEGCTISRDDLRYLRLSYHDFGGNTQLGELVCNKKVADDMTEIFRELYKRGYQIEKMKLIDDYGGDDDLSCADNNTSCFNYRTVAGSTNLSKHALGVAIDINPFYNPYVTYPNGVERISPPGSEPYADRSADFPHKIGPGDDAYELFKSHGFTWGGIWKTLKDYQHFQKV